MFTNTFGRLFTTPKADCSTGAQENNLDDPAFASVDPHAKYEDLDKMEEGAHPGMRRPPRRPLSFDHFITPIKFITKKYDQVKGFKFEVTGPGTHKFLMSHAWTIMPPSSSPQAMGQGQKGQSSTYTLSVQYMGGEVDPYNPAPPAFIMSGRMDTSGKLDAAFIKSLDEKTQLRLNAMLPNSDVNFANMQCDLEYEGDDFINAIKYGTDMWGFNYIQTIGRRLVLGFELLNLSARKQSLLSGACKYSYLKHAFYGHYSAPQNLLTLAYSQRVNQHVQLISELNINTLEGETKTVLGYRQKFDTTEVTATVNSKGKINSIVTLMSAYFQLKLCASADYLKDQYKFGYGISFGQGQ